jgi:hypothetical protein
MRKQTNEFIAKADFALERNQRSVRQLWSVAVRMESLLVHLVAGISLAVMAGLVVQAVLCYVLWRKLKALNEDMATSVGSGANYNGGRHAPSV